MEVKKSKKADLEGTKSTGLLIGYIVALAAMFACFEYTTRTYAETDVVYSTVAYAPETDIEEEKIESSEDTHEAQSGPSVQVAGPVMAAPGPVVEDGDENDIFEVVEQNPAFPGGEKALMDWLHKNLKYPPVAQENGIQGRVLVQFVVNKDGSIVDPKVIRAVDASLDKEAMRVVQAMPKWTPGRQRGKAVRVRFTLPVTFRLQ